MTQPTAVEFAFACMQAHPTADEILIDSIALLANLSVAEINRKILQDRGRIDDLTAGMQRWAGSSAVQAELCAAVANLAAYRDCGEILGNNPRTVALVLHALQRHLHSHDLQLQGYQALWSLLRYTAARQSLDATALCTTALTTLDTWPDDPAVATAVCNCLGRLFHLGLDLSASPRFADLVRRLARCLDAFPSDPLLQVTACFAIGHLVTLWKPDPPLAELLLRRLLDILRGRPSDFSVPTTAAFAISSLLVSSDINRSALLALGGIEVLVEAMLSTAAMDTASCAPAPGDADSGWIGGTAVGLEAISDVANKGANRFELFLLFASICVMNLGENAACRARLYALGGVGAVFRAAQLLRHSKARDLGYIIMFVFRNVTNRSGVAYAPPQPGSAASLADLARAAALRTLFDSFKEQERVPPTGGAPGELDAFLSWLQLNVTELELPILVEHRLCDGVKW
ncbi:hypothetical protein HK405_006359 [Cladochytrium tenue]|nr:hypothetical protein HK405_006359 [Cladochytrium tenue]